MLPDKVPGSAKRTLLPSHNRSQSNWTQCLMQYVARIIKKLNELQQNTETQLNEIKSHVDYDQKTQQRDRFLKRNQT